MSQKKKTKFRLTPIYAFAITWAILAFALPIQNLWSIILTALLSTFVSYLAYSAEIDKEQKAEKARRAEEQAKRPANRKSHGPQIDPIIDEGNRALSEMGRLYMSIKDPAIRKRINELMRITDKISQDAIADPSDIPQIKKFMNYYLPTTIKLLNSYDRMSSQGIEGENLEKSMRSIEEMLDAAVDAFKKRLDSLFENQALDIETDIEVMNAMLAREGLSGTKDFDVKGTQATQAIQQEKGTY